VLSVGTLDFEGLVALARA